MAKSFSNFGTRDLKIIRRALRMLYGVQLLKSHLSLMISPEQWAEATLENTKLQCRIVELVNAIDDQLFE